MSDKDNLVGQRFGRLRVVALSTERKGKKRVWTCLCDCGSITTVGTSDLRNGHSRSCGCLRRDASKARGLNLVGERFGFLVVTAATDERRKNHRCWQCSCDCGNTLRATTGHLRSGHTQSCGCWSKQATTTHGQSDLPEYDVWVSAKQRCTNPRSPQYKNYGGRGITMCGQWLNDFVQFYKDMGPRPEGMTLERIDCDGNYDPQNCKWATPLEQTLNRRVTRRFPSGELFVDAVKRLGVTHSFLYWRCADKSNKNPQTLKEVERWLDTQRAKKAA